jgi:hypothetical protein
MQDRHGDGTRLRFETGEHGGDFPDNLLQAITVTDAQARWALYVPLESATSMHRTRDNRSILRPLCVPMAEIDL